MNIKTKIEDWYDDLVFDLHRIRENIRAFFIGLGRWFSYFKVLMNIYDFDDSSILAVERHQITRVRDTIFKYRNHVDWERDVKYMNLSLKLLDIIEGDNCVKLIGPGFKTEPCENGLYKVVNDPDSKWILSVYVNTTNSQRFLSINKNQFEDPRVGPLMKEHLRIEKAWHLYHKLRVYHLRSWWD